MPKLRLPIPLILSVFFLFVLGQSYFGVREKMQRLERLRADVGTLRDSKTELEGELSYRQSQGYVEREAYEQLGWAREGEVFVVLPDLEKEKDKQKVAGAKDPEITEKTTVEALTEGDTPQWKRNVQSWGCLFFSSSYACP